MAVIKEYRCFAHGPFESREAKCPKGCTAVIQEFRTAPGFKSDKTKSSDKAIQRMATKLGYSDMSNRNGSVAGSRKMGKQEQDMRPQWLDVPKNKDREDKTDVLNPFLKSMNIYTDKVEGEATMNDMAKRMGKPKPIVQSSWGKASDITEKLG